MKLKKLLSKLNYLELILVCILCAQVLYLCVHKDTLLTRLLEIDFLGKINNFTAAHALIIIALIGVISLYLYIAHHLEIHFMIALLFLYVNVWIYLEYILQKNKKLTDKHMFLQDIANTCNTGDIILWNTPSFMSDIMSLLPILFVGMHHIGIVIKHNNKIYIFECTNNYKYCLYSKRWKTGPLLSDFKERIEGYSDDLYYIKTNLHTRITNMQLYNFIEKYKDLNYADNFINCISFLHEFLHEHNLVNEKYTILPPFINYTNIIDPHFYNFEYTREIYKITKE